MNNPRIISRQIVYKDPYQSIEHVSADFGQFKKEYFVRDSGVRVGVLVIRDAHVLLARQYRFLLDGLAWEIPGGKQESGESLEAAVIRECVEETGYACINPKALISYQPGLDIIHNPTHVFYSEDVRAADAPVSDEREGATFGWIPLTRCIEMVWDGEIVDALSIVALLAWRTKSRR